MTQEHPITPPPELFKQWEGMPRSLAFEAAYRAGADMELGACVNWLLLNGWGQAINRLRAARRPKPPSLKEQALEDFDGLMSELDGAGNYSNCAERIRRALEALPDD